MEGLVSALRVLVKILYEWLIAILGLLLFLLRLWRDWAKRSREHKWEVKCREYPSDLWRRPDVYIYSQQWFMARGIAVTWDNPDIVIRRKSDGLVADSRNLQADTEYEIVASVHNRSVMAPAIGVKVLFSRRQWGAGASDIPIGDTAVDVSVLGGSRNPAPAVVTWKTPTGQGHYCLLVTLEPVDDTDWTDNVGQENTNVVAASPGDEVTIEMPVFNAGAQGRRFDMHAGAYRLPAEPLKADPDLQRRMAGNRRARKQGRHTSAYLVTALRPKAYDAAARKTAMDERLKQVAANNGLNAFPVPEIWHPSLEPATVALPEAGSGTTTLKLRVPQDAKGEHEFHVWATDEAGALIGGVTAIVRVAG